MERLPYGQIMMEALQVPAGFGLSGFLLQSFHMGMLFEKDYKPLQGRNLNVLVGNPHGV